MKVMSHSVESPHEFEFEPLGSTAVTLSQAAIDWAVQVCQHNVDVNQQWRTFLRAMALQGFQQWLEAGALAVPPVLSSQPCACSRCEL